MICGDKNISELFSIFHDGTVTRYQSDGTDLRLEIAISYLAQRVNPTYRAFMLALHDVSDIRFETWPKEAAAAPRVMSNLAQIFVPELEILRGEVVGHVLKISFNQLSPQCDYCGGVLQLKADAATVTDDGGSTHTIDALRQICQQYWLAWKQENAERRAHSDRKR
jgi:hypothetical protein